MKKLEIIIKPEKLEDLKAVIHIASFLYLCDVFFTNSWYNCFIPKRQTEIM